MILTTIQAFCTLRTPFDIVFNALFNHGSNPIQPFQKYIFLQICSYLRPQGGGPDMILTAFDVKFHEKQDELPPGACNPQTKIKKTHKLIKKMQPKMGPPEPPPARAGGPGGGSPPGKPLCVA